MIDFVLGVMMCPHCSARLWFNRHSEGGYCPFCKRIYDSKQKNCPGCSDTRIILRNEWDEEELTRVLLMEAEDAL